jgi:hypothetical protein
MKTYAESYGNRYPVINGTRREFVQENTDDRHKEKALKSNGLRLRDRWTTVAHGEIQKKEDRPA